MNKDEYKAYATLIWHIERTNKIFTDYLLGHGYKDMFINSVKNCMHDSIEIIENAKSVVDNSLISDERKQTMNGTSKFIVLETFGGAQYAIVCVTPETGENMVFNTRQDAAHYAMYECQDGVVIEIA